MDFNGHNFRVIPMLNKYNFNQLPNGTWVGTERVEFGYLENRLNFKMK